MCLVPNIGHANLTQWPGGFWIRMRAGDALELLGDRAGALAHFEAAQQLATVRCSSLR
jgi:hypothetical protein